MQTGENVRMILDPIDTVEMPVAISDDSRNVPEQVRAALRLEQNWGAVFGRKYNVISDRGES